MRIGIDIGATTIKAALCEEDGTLRGKASAVTKVGDAAGMCEDLQKLALALCAGRQLAPTAVTGIGLGLPGSLDQKSCRLLFGPNLNMENVSFRNVFAPAFGCPVKIENDANCAALGEATTGAAKGRRDVIVLTIGTGIGGGILIDGALYTGANGIAGELGHMVIHAGGEPCNCGRRGCLETYTSAASFVRRVRRALQNGGKSKVLTDDDTLDGQQICAAVDAGDAFATEQFAAYCDDLACGLANYINIFQPECIVLGGGLAGYGEKLLAPLRERLKGQTFRSDGQNTELLIAALGNDAGVIGAAML